MEVAFGFVFGLTAESPAPSQRDGPRRTLERIVRSALVRPPCGVAFSGGRDSSLVLAIAVHVARREGLPDPVPITNVFPDVPETDESAWQETVVRHLGLDDWERVILRDELDLLGQIATRRLVEHGLVWPPTIHADVPALERLRGGCLIDGEGGDEVLGTALHRITPVTRLLRSPRPLRWRRVKRAVRAAAPARIRIDLAYLRRRTDEETPWLRDRARAARVAALAEQERDAPLSFSASVLRVPRRRSQALADHNRRLLAEPYDVDVVSPLIELDFVRAMSDDGGLFGRGDRTAVMRLLASDLLPDAVLSRTTKASFGGTYWGWQTREFAEAWSGRGVDNDLVDPDVLRKLWRSGDHNPLSSALIQAAWLADHHLTRTTTGSA
jgi:asparagine synthase (glutamine-hydrolysing)